MTKASDVMEAPALPRSVSAGLGRVGFVVFLLMVVLAPVPYGSKAPFWIVVWTALAGFVLLLADARRIERRHALMLCGAFLVLLAYLIVAWLQSVVPAVLPLDIWEQMWQVLGESGPLRSVAVRDAPSLFFLRPLLLLCVFSSAVIFSVEERNAWWLLRAVPAFTCIAAVVGLIALVLEIRELRPFDQGGSLVAFFVNRNTSATYMGSGFLILLALAVVQVRSAARRGNLAQAWKSVFATTENRILLFGLSLLFVLLPLTLSRAGLGITTVLAAATCIVFFVRRIRRWWVALGLFLAFFAAIYLLSGDQWRARQALVGFSSGDRTVVYGIMLSSILEHPLLGMGLGTFASVFPAFRTDDLGVRGIWDLGHSTPLELTFEGGVPLALVVLSFFAVCAGVLVQGVRRRPDDPYILAALLVGLLGALHSTIDFSLQLPGYAIEYMAVTGLGVGRALASAPAADRSRSRRRSRRVERNRSASSTPDARSDASA